MLSRILDWESNYVSERKLRDLALMLGVSMPVIYFGVQFVAAQFYEGYSFARMDASELGTDDSTNPMLFNIGAICSGVAAFIVAWGVFATLKRKRNQLLVTWLTGLGIACLGIGSINAGVHPLPDPRHISGPLAMLGLGMILIPFVVPMAVYNQEQPRLLDLYFVANVAALIFVALFVSGMVQRFYGWAGLETASLQHFLNNFSGVLQRITALAIYFPVSVCSIVLLCDRVDEN